MVTDYRGMHRRPDEGRVIGNPIGGLMTIKLRSDQTADGYSLHYNVLPAGSSGPRPHIHHRHDEAFYVLEGELTVRVGTETFRGTAGSTIFVPRGHVHQPSNRTDSPARVLIIFSPGGMDRFFEEVAEQKLPLQEIPSDPDVTRRLEAFLGEYHYDFAEFGGA